MSTKIFISTRGLAPLFHKKGMEWGMFGAVKTAIDGGNESHVFSLILKRDGVPEVILKTNDPANSNGDKVVLRVNPGERLRPIEYDNSLTDRDAGHILCLDDFLTQEEVQINLDQLKASFFFNYGSIFADSLYKTEVLVSKKGASPMWCRVAEDLGVLIPLFDGQSAELIVNGQAPIPLEGSKCFEFEFVNECPCDSTGSQGFGADFEILYRNLIQASHQVSVRFPPGSGTMAAPYLCGGSRISSVVPTP